MLSSNTNLVYLGKIVMNKLLLVISFDNFIN